MASAKVLGEVIDAVSKGRFVRVKGVGILVLKIATRQSRKTKEKKA